MITSGLKRKKKKKKHKIVVDEKEQPVNLRFYTFVQLDKDTKLEILKTIKKNFKKEFYKI